MIQGIRANLILSLGVVAGRQVTIFMVAGLSIALFPMGMLIQISTNGLCFRCLSHPHGAGNIRRCLTSGVCDRFSNVIAEYRCRHEPQQQGKAEEQTGQSFCSHVILLLSYMDNLPILLCQYILAPAPALFKITTFFSATFLCPKLCPISRLSDFRAKTGKKQAKRAHFFRPFQLIPDV